jgi:glycerol dehydrogenase-like iron-containing ADH family enzyme|tara:strand:- start:571 stop:1578 length:1008 start_codon:yes stop_codon:yes gene_type:complete
MEFNTVIGRNLLGEINHVAHEPFVVITMEDLWPIYKNNFDPSTKVIFVESTEKKWLDNLINKLGNYCSIIGLGGGQAIDSAKYFSWKMNKPFFQFPTSLSVDAVFGHRSAVRIENVVRYVGWSVPECVFIDLDIIKSAPIKINTAGIGDILCFITGVMDWQYARDSGQLEKQWEYDEELANTSLIKAQAVIDEYQEIKEMTDKGIKIMIDALKWGGSSYCNSGWNPRHIEGVEHLIFYSLEYHTKKTFLHGQAVCLGIVIGCMMHKKRSEELKNIINKIGVDINPKSMNIGWDEVKHSLVNLKDFVEKSNFMRGISNEYIFDENFFKEMIRQVED